MGPVGRAARANPDGYTLVVGNWGNFVVTGAIYSLAYDLQTAFEPISPWTTEPFIVVAKKTMAANNLRELVAWLKANSDKASIGTSGIGGPSHISGVIFQQLTGTRGQFVPYRGAAPAMQDLVAGQVDVMVAGASVVLPQKRADTIKTYAVAANNRLKLNRPLISPRRTRQDCQISICQFGTGFLRRKVRRKASLTNLTLRP